MPPSIRDTPLYSDPLSENPGSAPGMIGRSKTYKVNRATITLSSLKNSDLIYVVMYVYGTAGISQFDRKKEYT